MLSFYLDQIGRRSISIVFHYDHGFRKMGESRSLCIIHELLNTKIDAQMLVYHAYAVDTTVIKVAQNQ